MAVEIMRVRVCDQCGGKDGVRRYKVSRLQEASQSVTRDLCAKDGAPLEGLLETATSTRRRRKRVESLEEIEAQKPAKKAARKK